MTIGQIIYNRRKQLGLTLEEVGKAVGVSKSTVKKWEDGYISNMKRDKISLLAKVLDINPVTLVSSDCTIETYLPSMASDKAEEYLSSIYLPTDERKSLTKEILSKTETLSVAGMKKVIERIDELTIISEDNIHEDYRNAVNKTIEINQRNTSLNDYTQSIAAGTGGEGFNEEKINEVNDFAKQIAELENNSE